MTHISTPTLTARRARLNDLWRAEIAALNRDPPGYDYGRIPRLSAMIRRVDSEIRLRT